MSLLDKCTLFTMQLFFSLASSILPKEDNTYPDWAWFWPSLRFAAKSRITKIHGGLDSSPLLIEEKSIKRWATSIHSQNNSKCDELLFYYLTDEETEDRKVKELVSDGSGFDIKQIVVESILWIFITKCPFA